MLSSTYRLNRKTLWLGFISLLFFLSGWFPNAASVIYTQYIFPQLALILRLFSGLFSFAIGDILYGMLGIFALFFIVQILRKRKNPGKNNLLNSILQGLFILFLAYKLLWGLQYERPPLSGQLGLEAKGLNDTALVNMGHFFIKRVNSLHHETAAAGALSFAQLKEESVSAYQKLALKYPAFKYRVPSFKQSISSEMSSKMGIEGFYNPLSGEANLNTKIPWWTKPFVSCHEISHQLGIAREDEANLLGYLAAVGSDNPSFRYSANYTMLRYVLYEIAFRSPKDYESLYKEIDPAVIRRFDAERTFWEQYNGQMASIMTFTFDRFLKLNQQPQGIQSYQGIVLWLWGIHREDIENHKY